MKATKEIIGLRVISIVDGTEVGTVKDIVLNAQGASMDFIILDQPSDYLGAKVIAFKDILGIGEFAVTIPNHDVIQDVAHNTVVQDLLKQDVRVIGTKVLTKKGQLVGEVVELLIDEDQGQVAACLFVEFGGETRQVDAINVITFGKDLLIVEEVGTAKIADVKLDQEPHDIVGDEKEVTSEEGFNAFERRQLQYFVGKSVDKDVVLDDGEVLAGGEIITEEHIKKVTSRDTLMQITSQLQNK